MSADDGMRLVWLDFGGEDGEKVRTLFKCKEFYFEDIFNYYIKLNLNEFFFFFNEVLLR